MAGGKLEMVVAQPGGREFKIVLNDCSYNVIWRGRVAHQHGGREVDCSESGALIEATSLGPVSGIGFCLALAGPGHCIRESFPLRCSWKGGPPVQYIDICPITCIDSGK